MNGREDIPDRPRRRVTSLSCIAVVVATLSLMTALYLLIKFMAAGH